MFKSVSLAEMAAQVKAAETKTVSDPTRRAYFNVSKAAVNSTTILRPLPDGNPENILPFQVKRDITFRYSGVVGEETNGGEVIVRSVSASTFGKPCPVSQMIRPLWNSSADIARLYWPRATYIYQGFAVSSSVVEDTPENPIRLFRFGPQIHEVIKAALLDPDAEVNPFDLEVGRDFRVVKGTRGGFADYTKSSFGKSRPLSDAERAAIEKYGLFDLTAQLGEEPDAELLSKQQEMLRDSLSGLPYDKAKYNLPYFVSNGSSGGSTSGPADNAALLEALRRHSRAA